MNIFSQIPRLNQLALLFLVSCTDLYQSISNTLPSDQIRSNQSLSRVWLFATPWNSSTLATSCEELTHLKRPWCWEILKAGGEGDNREWDGWVESPIRWTSLSNLWELVKDREIRRAAVHGVACKWLFHCSHGKWFCWLIFLHLDLALGISLTDRK